MSYHEYARSRELIAQDEPFYALIMAAMRKADSANLWRLKQAWPEVWAELQERYGAPGGVLPGEARERW